MTPPIGMSDSVPIPAELLARMEEVKKYSERDRDLLVSDIIRALCEDYVRVQVRRASLAARQEEMERSYEEDPYDCREDFYGADSDQPGREG